MGRKQSIIAAKKLPIQAVIIGAAALPYALIIDPVVNDTNTWAKNSAVNINATALPSASNTSTNSLRNKIWFSY